MVESTLSKVYIYIWVFASRLLLCFIREWKAMMSWSQWIFAHSSPPGLSFCRVANKMAMVCWWLSKISIYLVMLNSLMQSQMEGSWSQVVKCILGATVGALTSRSRGPRIHKPRPETSPYHTDDTHTFLILYTSVTSSIPSLSSSQDTNQQPARENSSKLTHPKLRLTVLENGRAILLTGWGGKKW